MGGGSLVYANTLYEPTSAFYHDRQWARITDWQAELAPYYDQAKRMLGVVPNPTMTPSDEVLKQVAEEMGVGHTFGMAPVGVFFGREGRKEPGVEVDDPFFGGAGPRRRGCLEAGECMTGCRHNAKNTLVKNYLYLAERAGAKVHAETTAVTVRPMGSAGYAVDTVRTGAWRARRTARTLTAGHVVFAAGTWGTQQLLHRMKAQGWLPGISARLGVLSRTNSEALGGALTTRRNRTKHDFTRGIAITSSIHPDSSTHIEPVRYGRGSNAMGLLSTLMTDVTKRLAINKLADRIQLLGADGAMLISEVRLAQMKPGENGGAQVALLEPAGASGQLPPRRLITGHLSPSPAGGALGLVLNALVARGGRRSPLPVRAPPREHARPILLPAPRPARGLRPLREPGADELRWPGGAAFPKRVTLPSGWYSYEMRPSSRIQILQAAVRVTERRGITALTLEAAAGEAGLTKPGLMYHFRTRDDLLIAIQRHLTETWEGQLLAELGKPLEQSTAQERAAAYVRVNAHGSASKADLAFMVESATSSELAQVWNDLMARWVPQPPVPDPAQLDLFLARLAADGLWLFEATRPAPLAPEVKEALIRRIAALTEPPA